MKHNDQELENVLRSAPKPAAPSNLEETLIAEMRAAMPPAARSVRVGHPNGWTPNKAEKRLSGWATNNGAAWLRRWWPALGPAGVSLACAAVLTSQQLEIRSLKQKLAAPVEIAETRPTTAPTNIALSKSASGAETTVVDEQAEIQRLRNLAVKLSEEITRLHQMKDENEKLRAQLAASSFGNLTEQEKADLEKGKEKAQRIQCVNNLKQIGLAMRVWSLDNHDAYPPNFQVISNELSTPKILICPSDTAHTEARDFNSFSSGNCSYEYFVPGQDEKPAEEPNRVMVRCPIHGNIGLADGSVQSEVGKKHPEWLIQRDGKLYFQPPPNQ